MNKMKSSRKKSSIYSSNNQPQNIEIT